MCDNRYRHFRGVYTAGSYEVAGATIEGLETVAGWKRWLTAGSGDQPGNRFGTVYVALVYLGETDFRTEIKESQT